MTSRAASTPGPSPAPAELPLWCHCQTLRQAARRATALYDAAMAPFGLRISQYGILVRLRRVAPISLHGLAAELVLDRTTLGRNLRPLERDGLIASRADPADKRVRQLVITPAGEARLAEAGAAWQAAQAAFEAQFGVARAGALQKELLHLTRALAEPGLPSEPEEDPAL